MSRLFLRKSVEDCENDIVERGGLRRSLNKWHLTALGVGATIGAGIFATTGTAIVGDQFRPGAGPAIVVSFLLTAITCGFAALCYAEFAAMVPISGSAYTYAYASLGELVAWIIGWDLIVEYAVGNIGVAIGWSGYFRELLSHFGLTLPAWLATDFRSAHLAAEAVAAGATDASSQYLASAISTAPHIFGIPFIANLPAFFAVAMITCILVIGIRESASSNNAMVILKIGIILFFVAVGVTLIRPENWNSPELGGFAPNGLAGISAGAAIIFFSYIGFDATSTAAEEAKDPARDMPFGIIMSLVICTVMYILAAAVMTGMAPWPKLGTPEPMITALALAEGSPRLVTFSRLVVSLGAVVAMSSVLLVFQLGQPRIFMSMSRDGLLPAFFSRVHPRFRTPYIGTIITGLFVATFAAFANIADVVDLTNIGTLFAFVLVSAGVIVLRRIDPDRPRPFRAPWVPLTPILSIVSCLYLMIQLPKLTWIRFGIWLALGLVIYFLYGIRNSRLARERGLIRSG
jgi:APA family basic amino acid/polyamine antiporter